MLDKLAVGTVQLGMQYGRANKTGKPSFQTASDILDKAFLSGIKSLDTARAYGDSEEVIGKLNNNRFVITTKLSPLYELNESSSEEDVIKAVNHSLITSFKTLQKDKIDILLLHRWSHRRDYKGLIWNILRQYQSAGKIGRLGVSVSNPEEALEAIKDADVQFIQLPFNILDWRWKNAQIDIAASKRNNLTIQARSVLLQGILTSEASAWPAVEGVDSGQILNKIDNLVKKTGRKNRKDLCYSYVGANKWIGSIVIGVETLSQLEENIELFSAQPLNHEQCIEIEELFCDIPQQLLNPALW